MIPQSLSLEVNNLLQALVGTHEEETKALLLEAIKIQLNKQEKKYGTN